MHCIDPQQGQLVGASPYGVWRGKQCFLLLLLVFNTAKGKLRASLETNKDLQWKISIRREWLWDGQMPRLLSTLSTQHVSHLG